MKKLTFAQFKSLPRFYSYKLINLVVNGQLLPLYTYTPETFTPLLPLLPQNDSLAAPKWVKIIKMTEYITFIQLLL